MKSIDIDNWKRKKHYNFFKQLDYPHFNICANIDITNFKKYLDESNLPFFVSILHMAMKTANSIEEFRYRIRGESVVVHDRIEPTFTIMGKDEVFSFCNSRYIDDLHEFIKNTVSTIKEIQENPYIKDEPDKDDVVYITSIPWVSFTSLSHPIHIKSADSIPRIAWGKYFESNNRIMLPLSVQVNHALVDGIHVGKYFKDIQTSMNSY